MGIFRFSIHCKYNLSHVQCVSVAQYLAPWTYRQHAIVWQPRLHSDTRWKRSERFSSRVAVGRGRVIYCQFLTLWFSVRTMHITAGTMSTWSSCQHWKLKALFESHLGESATKFVQGWTPCFDKISPATGPILGKIYRYTHLWPPASQRERIWRFGGFADESFVFHSHINFKEIFVFNVAHERC